jgi:hypothetical protein
MVLYAVSSYRLDTVARNTEILFFFLVLFPFQFPFSQRGLFVFGSMVGREKLKSPVFIYVGIYRLKAWGQ